MTRTVYFVMQVWNLWILSTHFIHSECLHYSGTRTGYYIMRNYVYIILWHGLSTLFRHKDLSCLLYSFTLTVFFIMATNVCISMACVFTIPSTVFLITSSGVVYVVQALGVSTLVCPPHFTHNWRVKNYSKCVYNQKSWHSSGGLQKNRIHRPKILVI